MQRGRPFFEAAVAACRRIDRRAALVTAFRDQVPADLPAGIRRFDPVPFLRLFPRAAAVVHHGGIGTTANGLAAGVPQLVMPMAYDQHDNASRLEALGVAISLAPGRFRGPRVARSLDALLNSPAIEGRCRRLADRLGAAEPPSLSDDLIGQAGRK